MPVEFSIALEALEPEEPRDAPLARNDHRATDPESCSLPTVLDVPQAARLLGIGRTLAYELVRTNQWPTPVIRMGRLIKIPSWPIVELMTTGATVRPQRAS